MGKRGRLFSGEGGGGLQFSPKKKKLQSEIIDDKKVYKQKYFSLSQLRIQTGKSSLRI